MKPASLWKHCVFAYSLMVIIPFIRGDGFFPLSKNLPISTLMFFILAHTLLFGAGYIVWSFYALRQKKEENPLQEQRLCWLIFWGGLLSLALSFIYHLGQQGRFSQFGYQWTPWIWTLFGSASLICEILLLIRIKQKKSSAADSAFFSLLAVFILKIPPILDFPLHILRSDMLLNIDACARDLLNFISPYYYHNLGGFHLPNVRLPSMLAAYAPLTALHLDLRWGKLIFETITVILMFSSIKKLRSPLREAAFCMLLIFWTSPYLAFRHDIYDAPFWLLIWLCMITFNPRHLILNGLLVGFLGSTHQWGWVAIPFLTMYQFRSLSFKQFAIWLSGCVGILLITLAPFIVFDFKNFVAQLFGNYGMVGFIEWKEIPNNGGWARLEGATPSMSLRPWLLMTDFGYRHSMHLLLGLLSVGWFTCVFYLRKNLRALLWGVSLAWLTSLWLMPTGWTYQYFNLLFYILALQIITWKSTPLENHST